MKRIVVAMTTIAAFASPAFALTEQFTHSTPVADAPFTDDFTLIGFDPSLGTLTGIRLALSTNSTAEVDITNKTTVSQPFTNATATIPITLTGPAGVSTTQNLKAGPYANTAPVGDSTFSGITGTATSTADVSPANFASYETSQSAPNLAFDVTGQNGIYTGSAAAKVLFGGSASVGGTTQIIYTYTAPAPPPSVPEPAAITIFGLGLAGLSMLRRRQG